MQLDVLQPNHNRLPLSAVDAGLPSCWIARQAPKMGDWVQLLELPNPFSFNEALLLCQRSEDQWVAWIPNHGEAVLNTHQFCPTT